MGRPRRLLRGRARRGPRRRGPRGPLAPRAARRGRPRRRPATGQPAPGAPAAARRGGPARRSGARPPTSAGTGCLSSAAAGPRSAVQRWTAPAQRRRCLASRAASSRGLPRSPRLARGGRTAPGQRRRADLAIASGWPRTRRRSRGAPRRQQPGSRTRPREPGRPGWRSRGGGGRHRCRAAS